MKFFLGILLFLASVIFGYISSTKFTKRTDLFSEFCAFNQLTISEVEFAQNTINTIINSIDSSFAKDVKSYLEQGNFIKYDFLNEEENNLILTYLKNVGAQDKISQLQYLKKIDLDINRRLDVCKEEMKKYKSLYVKVGYLVGLILFVLVL
ncbi:MAG: hypothetical protein E7340_03095 [Clostridiales bacterium]|nr:hypothetical protein [Clostridiales bacterium]